MAIKEERAISVAALSNLLKDVVNESSSYADEDFISALKSQGKLAKYENKKLGIIPCSLNTLKTASDAILDGGYESLDRLRVNALNRIEINVKKATEKTTMSSKAGLQSIVKDQDSKIKKLEQHNMMLTCIISSLRENARKYAKMSKDKQIQALCEKEMKELNAQLMYTNNSRLLEELNKEVSNGS